MRAAQVGLGPTAAARAGWLGALVVAGSAAGHAPPQVAVTGMQWEFYQGGSVSSGPGNFQAWQDHYGGSPARNDISSTVGGAAFASVASLGARQTATAERFTLTATADFDLIAAVAPGWPQGAADAFGGLSVFSATIQIHGGRRLFEYSGPPLSWMGNGSPITSGTVLDPGEYVFYHVDPFPGAGYFWQTRSVGAGQSDRVQGRVQMRFDLTTVPAPGAGLVWLMALGMAGLRRPRR
jgi:MYXO-CTERM domain-containing protein